MDTQKQPNILLIMADQFRGDCMGIAGHPDVKTPYIDTLAAKGTLFENAYTATPSCIPARCALFTGQSQARHGRVGYRDGVPWEYPVTLAGELSSAGYYTQCVGKMHVHPLRNRMGFHHIELHDGYLHYYRKPDIPHSTHQAVADDYFYWLKSQLGADRDVTDTGVECNSFVARPWPYDEKYHPTNWVTDRSIDFLRRRDRSQPFFLMSSYVRPHPPFDAPACFFDMYRDKPLRPPHIGRWENRDRLREKGRLCDADTGPADEETMTLAQIGYYACISHLDNQIGRLIMALQEDGSYNDTVIVFCSDHGELLGDHHTYRKTRPYQGSVHIPMIVSNCEALTRTQGRRSDMLVELRDIFPTFMEMAGQPAPEGLDGHSMLRENHRAYLHGEHSGGDIGNHYIVTRTEKYCWFTQTGEEQLFDLEVDPYECVNRIEERPERAGALREILIRELNGREEEYSDGISLIPGRPERAVLSQALGMYD